MPSARAKRGHVRVLEFDHIIPTARGGKSVALNLRLLCRSHNQHAADRIFGRDFMEAKRRANSPCPGKVLVPKAILSGLKNLASSVRKPSG